MSELTKELLWEAFPNIWELAKRNRDLDPGTPNYFLAMVMLGVDERLARDFCRGLAVTPGLSMNHEDSTVTMPALGKIIATGCIYDGGAFAVGLNYTKITEEVVSGARVVVVYTPGGKRLEYPRGAMWVERAAPNTPEDTNDE